MLGRWELARWRSEVRRLLSRCGWDAEGSVESKAVRDCRGDSALADVDEMGSSVDHVNVCI